jgi:transposase
MLEVASRFEIDDALWAEVEPLIPPRARRSRYPGRLALDDREALNGILFVLHTGIAWRDLPQELGYGSGVTCWRRLRTWQQAGVWEALHRKLVRKLNAAGQIDWSRAAIDGSHIRTLLGGSSAGHPQ